MDSRTHRYAVRCEWTGSTGAGYDAYDRAHRVSAPPAGAVVTMSADPAFLGRGELLNPEQLLLAAASSCQLLAFLAVAARARVDVVAYEDTAEALMPEDDTPMRITAIHLRPRITVRGGGDEERVVRLVELAHRECFIANSLRTEIRISPTITLGIR